MKRSIFVITLMFAIACSTSPKTGTESAPGKSAGFQIRSFEQQTLDNGLTVLWLPDNSLPYVSLQLMVKSGSSQDPVGKEGLAAFTGSMLEKGTKKRTAVQISEDLEQIGSGFGVEVNPDYTVASTSALSFDKNEALANFTEIVMTPSFPGNEIERHRKLMLGSLQKLADRPDDFTEYLLPRFMYGKHPYGHEASGSPGSIKSLSAKDLKQFYEQNFTPANSVLAVVGQFDGAWRGEVVKAFSGWKTKGKLNTDVPEFPAWKGTESLLVDRADLNQAQIQIGFKGVPRKIPEYMELRAALKILGESFGSRLFDEIRDKRGLTYHINAWFDPRLKPGPMGIYTFTRIDKIGETVEETLKTYRNFVSGGVTDAEVTEVKALMHGQFPRTFETPEALARQLLLLNRYDVGPEYLTNYLRTLDAMTKESINATIRKYFDPSNLKILVYAPRGKAEETLRKLGKLEVKSYKEFLQ